MPPYTMAAATRSARNRGPTPGPGPSTAAGVATTRNIQRTTKPSTGAPLSKSLASKRSSLKRTSSEALSNDSEDESGSEDDDGVTVNNLVKVEVQSQEQEGDDKRDKTTKRRRRKKRKVKAALTLAAQTAEGTLPLNQAGPIDKGKRRANTEPVTTGLSMSSAVSRSTVTATGESGSSTHPAPSASTQRDSQPVFIKTETDAIVETPTGAAQPTAESADNLKSAEPTPTRTQDKGKGRAAASQPSESSSGVISTSASSLRTNATVAETNGPAIPVSDPATDALREEIARLKREVAEHQHLPANLTQHVTCLICFELLWRPFGVVPCGHVVCYGCLVRWFCAPPPGVAVIPNPPVAGAIANAGGAGAVNDNAPPAGGENNAMPDGEDQELQRLINAPHARRGAYMYRHKTCPVCRCAVHERPVEVWAMKAVVAVMGRAAGQEAPAGAAANANQAQVDGGAPREQDPWKNMFPPVGRRQHGARHRFFTPPFGDEDEDEDEEERDIVERFGGPFLDIEEDDFDDEENEPFWEEIDDAMEAQIEDAIFARQAQFRQAQLRRERDQMLDAGRARAPWRLRGVGQAIPAPRRNIPLDNQGRFGFHDVEDGGIYRCWDCMHEIWGGVCDGCGRAYEVPHGHHRIHDLDDDDDMADREALEEELAWLEEDAAHADAMDDEEEDEDEEHEHLYEFPRFPRHRHVYDVDEEEDEEPEPGEFDGWLEEDDEVRVREGFIVDDEDAEPDDDHQEEYLGTDEEDIVPDYLGPFDVEDGEEHDLGPINRRVQLAALRRRGLILSDNEGDEEGDHAEDVEDQESDDEVIEVVEYGRRPPPAARRIAVIDLTDDEDDPPVRRIGGRAGPVIGGARNGRGRFAARVVSDDDDEPVRAVRRQAFGRAYIDDDE